MACDVRMSGAIGLAGLQAIPCLLLLCLLLSVFPSGLLAQIAVDRVPESEDTFDGYFELGVSVFAYRQAMAQESRSDDRQYEIEESLTINGAWRYRCAFLEFVSSSVDGVNLGLNLWKDARWSVDWLLPTLSGSVTVGDDEPLPDDADAARSLELLRRDRLFVGIGPRVTGYFGPWLTQFRLIKDMHESHGFIANARLGRQWQRGNWNLHAVGGLRYFSERTAQFWWGVEPQAASSRFPSFEAEDNLAVEGEVGVAFPITQDWVFRSALRGRRYGSNAIDSPLIVGNSDTEFELSLIYVF